MYSQMTRLLNRASEKSGPLHGGIARSTANVAKDRARDACRDPSCTDDFGPERSQVRQEWQSKLESGGTHARVVSGEITHRTARAAGPAYTQTPWAIARPAAHS